MPTDFEFARIYSAATAVFIEQLVHALQSSLVGYEVRPLVKHGVVSAQDCALKSVHNELLDGTAEQAFVVLYITLFIFMFAEALQLFGTELAELRVVHCVNGHLEVKVKENLALCAEDFVIIKLALTFDRIGE